MSSLRDQVAIVTGASKGIGRAITRALAQQGCKVAMVARTAELLHELHRELAEQSCATLPICADITDDASIDRIVAETLQWAGRIDILVNNAGIGIFKPVVEMAPEDFDAMWRLNMRAVFLLTRAVLPHMISAQHGAIVNIASLAGKNTFANGSGYAATKWALRGWAGCLMAEVRQHNIRVVTICPGSVDTSFSQLNKRGENITQPEDVAAAVVFALTAPERTMVSEIDLRPTRP